VSEVCAGSNLAHRQDLSDQTICNYLSAAAQYLASISSCSVSIYAADGKSLIPYFKAILSDRRTWQQSRPKREPLTGLILDAMARRAAQSHPLALEAALYDWCRLGVFTGSRLSEYAQSVVAKGQSWATIPAATGAPREWVGKPIAFVASDFTFLSANRHLLSHEAALQSPSLVRFLVVRFRFDKSAYNFTSRTFQRIEHHHLCPVAAALSIVARASFLGPLSDDVPLGRYRSTSHNTLCIKGAFVSSFMQRCCIDAYPDPQHHMRQHIEQLHSHSLRITAAVALQSAGVSVQDISFRLRWHSDAVLGYLRDCNRLIGQGTIAAVNGAYL